MNAGRAIIEELRAKSEGLSPQPSALSPDKNHPVRILLVEDEPPAAQVLAKGLREQAYAVDVAGDGEAALFQVSTTDYDAIILDVMLPVKSGLTVCRAVRASGSAVPILMLTAR